MHLSLPLLVINSEILLNFSWFLWLWDSEWERNHSGQQSGYGASKSDTCFLLFYTRTDENLISRPGTNGYVSKLPSICPYGRAKASLLPKIFCLRKHVSSFADCFTGMVSFFVVYWLLHIRVEKRSVEKRKAVRLVPCQARLAERIRVWLGVDPDSFGCSYVLAS